VPGFVKHTSTPPATRVSTRLSAPFMKRDILAAGRELRHSRKPLAAVQSDVRGYRFS